MSLTTRKTVAAIEAGGTKFVVAIGRGDQIGPRITIPTTDPNTTLSSVVDAIKTELEGDALNAIGIASFGPIDINKTSQTYGEIGATPKAGWAGVNLQTYFSQAFGCPVGIESDVNGAALAEAHWGRPIPINHLAYVTVGTGIGVGVIQNGIIANGTGHPEMGHIRVPPHLKDTSFSGVCPFHGNCVEGMASGPAIFARWQATLSDLDVDHIAHEIEAYYLGQLALHIVLHHRPERLVLGGGVNQTPHLLPRIREQFQVALAGYLPNLDNADAVADLIQPARLGLNSGIRGAFMLGAASA
jgi:fructokinase